MPVRQRSPVSFLAFKGKFVLIKDDDVVDVFDSKIDAIREGYKKFGNIPFLVRQRVELDMPQNLTSNLLGL